MAIYTAGRSQIRDGTQATAVTYTAAAARLDALAHCTRPGIEPACQQGPKSLQRQHGILNLLHYSRNANTFFIMKHLRLAETHRKFTTLTMCECTIQWP